MSNVHTSSNLIDLCDEAVSRALDAGADQAEAFASHGDVAEVSLQKDDIHLASTASETTLGLRVLVGNRPGFVTINGRGHVARAALEAVALARSAPEDSLEDLPAPDSSRLVSIAPPDEAIEKLDIEGLVEHARAIIDRVKMDARVSIDSGSVYRTKGQKAIVSSRGIRASECSAQAGGSLFGMAIEGNDVGSFDHDGHSVLRLDELEPELMALCDRFVIKTTSALNAEKGESFRGTIILSPEVVLDFVLDDLLSALSARAVRTGRSPFAESLGQRIASESFDLRDEPHLSDGAASTSFDREGTPTRPLPLVENGVLSTFLYDAREARAAGVPRTGHARGGASSAPIIGPSNLVLRAGTQSFSTLCGEVSRAVLVSRFSGSTDATTGEFSGVVKGGYLLTQGTRRPIKETLISGNLFKLLENISGVSREVRMIGGSDRVPALRVEDVSVTAG